MKAGTWAILFAVFLGTSAPAEDAPFEGWVEARTPHFRFLSNASRPVVVQLATDLERFREALGVFTSGYRFDGATTTTVFLFRDGDALEPYARNHDGDSDTLSGYHAARWFSDFLAMDGRAGQGTHAVAYHELVHSILRSTFPGLPLWLHEGLAEYYSTFRYAESSRRLTVGHVIRHHTEALRRDGFMSFHDLSRVTQGSVEYNEAERRGLYYAHSWLLTHYMIADPARREVFNRLLSAARAPREDQVSFLGLVGRTDEELRSDLEGYLSSGVASLSHRLDRNLAPIAVTTRPAGPEEVLLGLGGLLACRDGRSNGDAAVEHLSAALERGAAESEIRGWMGFVAQRNGRHEEAITAYRQALAGGNTEADVEFGLAVLLLDRAIAHHGIDLDDRIPSDVGEARALLRDVAARFPHHVDTLFMLGRTFLFDPEPENDGLRLLSRAGRLAPDRHEIFADLACLSALSGRHDAAWSIFRETLIPAAAEGKHVESTGRCLASAEMSRIGTLLETGHVEAAQEGIARLEENGLASHVDSPLRRAKELIAGGRPLRWFGTQEGEVSALVAEDRMDEAIAKAQELAERCEELEGCPAEFYASRVRLFRRMKRFDDAIQKLLRGDRSGAIEDLQVLSGETVDRNLAERIRIALRELGAPPR